MPTHLNEELFVIWCLTELMFIFFFALQIFYKPYRNFNFLRIPFMFTSLTLRFYLSGYNALYCVNVCTKKTFLYPIPTGNNMVWKNSLCLLIQIHLNGDQPSLYSSITGFKIETNVTIPSIIQIQRTPSLIV